MRLEMEWQLRGVSDCRPRRPAARQGWSMAGQLGRDRQAAAAAEQPAVRSYPISCSTSPTAAFRWRRRSGRSASRLRASGSQRRLQGTRRGRQPAAVPGPLRRDRLCAPMSRSRSSRGPRSIDGPFTLDRFDLPASRFDIAAPRFDARPASTRSFTSVDGSGRMAIATLIAGANGLANFVGELSFKGPLRRWTAR